jgi:putative CocE/NonD family hydrolase
VTVAKLSVPAVSVAVEHNAPAEMRDGTVLRADVYRPALGGPFPVLLIRNPYGEQMIRTAPVIPAVERGLAVVVQHVRGTGTSDGDFVPFENEAADGADTVEWCARQHWSNGNVAMLGPSYLGMVQLAAASRCPDALKCLVPIVTPADYHDSLVYRQGTLQLGQLLGWHTLKSGQALAYRAAAGEDISADLPALIGLMTDMGAGYAHLPAQDVPAVSRIIPTWRTWLSHEERDDFWQNLGYADRRQQITTPALHVGGWFDLFLAGTLDNFVTLSRGAATEHARRNQRLLIGPWTHVDQTGAAGELHFGLLASAQAIQLEQIELDFVSGFVAPGGQAPAGPRVKLFVMGENVWRDEEEWPLARTRWARWYLHAGGSLSPSAPAPVAEPSRYVHDPHDPVPTTGGATLMSGGPGGGVSWMPGPRDQRQVEARPDVLSFTSDPLATDVEVTGPVSVTLHAATSAADADFTAKLVDVWPDGRALGVADGIVRARYRDGSGRARPVPPGQVCGYTISLVATSQVFAAGHRIRVDVSSSNFPCFDRNPGNGAPAATATEEDFVTAEQTICHDRDHPSYITLPVIPR